MIDEIEREIQECRRKQRNLLDPSKKAYDLCMNKKEYEKHLNKEPRITDVESLLIRLKKNEPTSDNRFFRLSIIAYELGDLNRAIVYANRFNESNGVQFGSNWKSPDAVIAEGKLAMLDLLTQLHMLCLSMNWDFEELRELGAQHLEERQKDFIRDGWTEVEK